MKAPINEIIDEVYKVIKEKDFNVAYPQLQQILGSYASKYSKELVIDALLQLSLILGYRLYHCEKKLYEDSNEKSI